jgi:hypothetical protein
MNVCLDVPPMLLARADELDADYAGRSVEFL